jgi:hypothetical protein
MQANKALHLTASYVAILKRGEKFVHLYGRLTTDEADALKVWENSRCLAVFLSLR